MRGGNSLPPPPQVYLISAQSVLAIIIFSLYALLWGFPTGSVIKNPPALPGDTGDVGPILGSERAPGEKHGYSFQGSHLENPMVLRSLVGCSPWGHKESNMTEAIEHSLAHALFWKVHEFIH